MSSINIHKLSVQWGYWATPRFEGEYPRVSAGFAEMKRDARHESTYRIEPISDELGMQVDGYMRIMREVTPELYDVFVLTFVKRWERCEIWKYLNLSRSEYYNRLDVAKKSLLLMLLSKDCIFLA
ncbi:antiterminator Q family protein [Aggregatibacter actinomycetemcomitans]|uniref:antiterminator Q family protein n=1 Tax=Aggregatibacter actinomycetemcomitans TaxID=714 RepID=UPI00215AD635|nr:antiterminator Q family protein [Aggregatibacter actinomycetemcomitans]